MALEEEQSSTAQELRRAIDSLRECADFVEVEPEILDALATGAVHFSLPAGNSLFEFGAQADGLYLVVSGKLGIQASKSAITRWTAEIGRGELVGESGWLLREPRSATVMALRDCELLLLPHALLDTAAARSSKFSLSIARLCARRLRRSNRQEHLTKRAHIFAIVPNSEEIDVLNVATLLVAELARTGRVELVWDIRASTHTSAWFSRLEELNDYVVYVADPTASGWTRQCCRQADVILLAALARADFRPWPTGVADTALSRGARIELALLHEGSFVAGAATRWLAQTPVALHHHIVDADDYGRVARLLTRRGVGLVLSGGGARGFAHLGIIRALREARVPIDFVGGVSIGAIIAAGVAVGWSDSEMQLRYRRSFVATNPVNDYTFPLIALTRGRKVAQLLQREYGDILIEDLRRPFFCISANLTTGRTLEHRDGNLAYALRASVAIPGVMPPIFRGEEVLIDGAAINNLPVDIMQAHAPGLVIGSDVGAQRNFAATGGTDHGPPLWKFFAHGRNGKRRINIFQILMHAGMINSASSAAAQRELADVLLKPPLANIDLLDWQAFDRAIDAGYEYARHALQALPAVPRLPETVVDAPRPSSLAAELDKRSTATGAAG